MRLVEMWKAIERAESDKSEIYRQIQQSAGKQLKRERENHNPKMTQVELAKKLHVGVSWISRLENGAPMSKNTLKRIVEVLGEYIEE